MITPDLHGLPAGMQNKSRVFLGIPIRQSHYEKLKRLLLCAHHVNFSDGHWILPENVHITMRFFGESQLINNRRIYQRLYSAQLKNEIGFIIKRKNTNEFN